MQVSVKKAAEVLGVYEDQVYRWIKQGEMPAVGVGEEWRVDRAELLEWATGRGMKVDPSLFEGGSRGQGELPTLLGALGSGGIVRGLGGDDQGSVLRSVVDCLPLPEDVDRDYLYEIMLARENLGSTGIGEGIAIPHVRDPLVFHVPEQTVTLCFLERPVDFKAIDGKPVDTIFAIVSPTVRDHLHILSRLGYALRDEAFRRTLRSGAGRDELFSILSALEAGLAAAHDA
ncbi:MAG: PTS sugar transporter subunit IIA [Spirochaetota bacterium]